MNLTLFKLRKRLKRDKSGMGSLVGVILGGVLLSTIVASGTSWYLTMRNNLGNTEDKLEAQTIAMSEWERLSHMSLDELEANRNNFKTPYSAGTGSQFSISVNLGEKGTFNNGTCGNVTGGYANCFKNTTITVYRDGNRMFTTRTLPLMAGDYTRKEIDAKLSAEASARSNKDTDLQNQINNLTARLNGKEFIKNKTPNYDLNLRYEKKAGEDKFTLHAYNGNTEIPLASAGDSELPVSSNKGYFRIGKTLVQYGRELKPVSSAVTDKIFFPIPFNNLQSISITPVAANPATLDIHHNLHESAGSVGVFHMDNTGFDVIYGDDFNGVYIHWIAIGT